MASQAHGELDDVVSSIEQKLETLEEKRDELRREIELKRAEIRDLTNTLKKVRALEDKLAGE